MKTANPLITVALADDHIVLRHALATLMNSSGICQVIYEFNNGQELINQLKPEKLPDVIILDMNMPLMDGYETAAWVSARYPDVRILMLTMYDSELTLIRLLQAGVKGFLKKDVHPSELLNAIQAVHEFGYYYSSQTSSKLAGLFRESKTGQSPLEKIMLDETELEFLGYSASEMTYKEIAQRMNLNPRAIDGIRDNLFQRLDVKSRVGLAMYAIRHGVVKF